MKKNFIYLFIINVMLMTISFILMTIYQYNNKSSLLATIITLTTVIIFGVVILSLIYYSISQMLFAKRTNLMINDANKLISRVEEKQNYVFMLNDINSNLDVSPFGNKYKKNSYITTFNKIVDICLTDGKYSIIKNINTKELELIKGNVCNLELEEKETSLYIKERLYEKYNINFDVYNCKRNNDYDSVFNNKTGLTCEIKYKDKNYTATLYDNKLELIDSYVGEKNEK